jgi:ribosomal protein L40E
LEIVVTRLTCPACTAPSLEFNTEGILTCPYCGTRIIGEAKVCSACGHLNPRPAEQCLKCGEPLTVIARVVLRHGNAARNPAFLERARGQAAGLKADEVRASQERMDRFREMDRLRLTDEAEAYARQQVRDRRILIASASALGILVIAILISLLAALLR